MSGPNFLPNHKVDVDMYYGISENFTCWWRWRKSQKIAITVGMDPLGTLNICCKSHGYPSNSCKEISL